MEANEALSKKPAELNEDALKQVSGGVVSPEISEMPFLPKEPLPYVEYGVEWTQEPEKENEAHNAGIYWPGTR